ncbi:hypothetical protein DSM19430T_19140 [Desulfovibrio psychrotolerans]|uniref:Uncharacterized protein n=1 Tax=Desulfovibrio psychrotolerans TaxID=415242 RepID=A0A7J0BU40_9BACT|nr:hypothetical protein DSM19430T_19140 [Desulfovibrio psychrotolerans]
MRTLARSVAAVKAPVHLRWPFREKCARDVQLFGRKLNLTAAQTRYFSAQAHSLFMQSFFGSTLWGTQDMTKTHSTPQKERPPAAGQEADKLQNGE